MASTGFKLNPGAQAKWKAAMTELRFVMKKENPEGTQKLVLASARRFVKNVADVTPPASGKADSGAKKAGEMTILTDLLKLAIPTTVAGSARRAREVLASAEDLVTAHERARNGVQGGRVNPRNRKEKLLVSQATFNRVLARLQKMVGWLAAGLNAAAARLGFSLPAWIKRHGDRFGRITVKASENGISIRIVQAVPFADDVKGYGRRWNFALEKEIRTIVQQVHIIWDKEEAKIRAKLSGKR